MTALEALRELREIQTGGKTLSGDPQGIRKYIQSLYDIIEQALSTDPA